jgi:hypothetical protein
VELEVADDCKLDANAVSANAIAAFDEAFPETNVVTPTFVFGDDAVVTCKMGETSGGPSCADT